MHYIIKLEVTIVNILTFSKGVTIRWGLNWILGLLTSYTQLVTTSNYNTTADVFHTTNN
jgi:hypothetical protein